MKNITIKILRWICINILNIEEYFLDITKWESSKDGEGLTHIFSQNILYLYNFDTKYKITTYKQDIFKYDKAFYFLFNGLIYKTDNGNITIQGADEFTLCRFKKKSEIYFNKYITKIILYCLKNQKVFVTFESKMQNSKCFELLNKSYK